MTASGESATLEPRAFEVPFGVMSRPLKLTTVPDWSWVRLKIQGLDAPSRAATASYSRRGVAERSVIRRSNRRTRRNVLRFSAVPGRLQTVMAGLDSAVQVIPPQSRMTWMPAINAGMTIWDSRDYE